MDSGGVVTVSADKIIELANRIKNVENELRQIGLDGFMSQPTTHVPPRQQSKTDPIPIEFNVLGLDWKLSKRAGGGPAGPGAKWAWDYGYPDSDSLYPRDECYELVESIKRYGEVRCGIYTIKLRGRDNRLLNRTIE